MLTGLLSGDFPRSRALSALNSAGIIQVHQRSIDIVDAGHPIAAGLSGVVDVSTKDRKISYARVGPAADVVATPYRDTNRPSGIVCRCIGWNRPILAADSGWLKWACDRLQAGNQVNVESRAQFAQAIKTSLDDSHRFNTSAAGQLFSTFNTMKNYQATWQRESSIDAQEEQLRSLFAPEVARDANSRS